jgi:ElaB/YqjD/DUF883 family membrane-anchored ribosome-binding protein
LVAGIGGFLLWKGLKAFSKNSIKPRRTLETLHDLGSGPAVAGEGQGGGELVEEELTSQELQGRVRATEARLGAELDEVGRRLSPRHIKEVATRKIRANPYQVGGMAMAVGFVTGYLLKRK